MPIIKTRSGQPIQTEGQGITITQTPTLSTAAYTAGDAVGGLLTFANAALDTGGGGIINSVVLIDDSGQDDDMELWLFDTAITAIADAAAWALTEAQLHTLITIVKLTSAGWAASGTPSANVTAIFGQRYYCTGKNLYGQLVCRGTPTFTAVDDITVRLGLTQVV